MDEDWENDYDNGENPLSEADIDLIKKKLAEPNVFVNGRRKFKEEVRPLVSDLLLS